MTEPAAAKGTPLTERTARELSRMALQVLVTVLLGLLAWNARAIDTRLTGVEQAQAEASARQAATDAYYQSILNEIGGVKQDVRDLRLFIQQRSHP